MIRFSAPLVLLGIGLLPMVGLALRGRNIRRPLVALRATVLALLVLAAAGMHVMRATDELTVVFAADRSDSIGPEGAHMLRAFLDQVRRQTGPSQRIGLVTFGADAILEEAPVHDPRLALASRPRPDGTNIAAAITRALEALPEGPGRRIVLMTDGQATAGNLREAVAVARSRGVELAVVPLASGPVPEVLLEEVIMPNAVAVGERLPITVRVRATEAAEGTLRVRANATLLLSREVQLKPGRTTIDLEAQVTQAGLLRVDASIDAEPDTEPANNRMFALALVQGRPFVLYVGEPAGPLVGSLEAQGLSVRRMPPVQLPVSPAAYSGVAAVVLDDVPAFALSPQQMVALRDYVRVGGGGLVAIGGSRSFGIGGYAGTPLEEVLPVSMDVRHRLAIPSIAIVLVIDASGSMGSFGPETAKVELAKDAAQSVIDLLGERDLVGVIAFDQTPRWVVPLTRASEHSRILDAVSRIKAGGGTSIYPALLEAREALRRTEARIKHAIVLSDFQTDPGDFRGLATKMVEERMTVSTVAVGRDAELELTRSIAAWGRGRAYEARDIYSIPQIFAAEAMLVTRASVIEERFTPRIVRAQEILADLGSVPPLRGYLATAPKPAAQVIVQSHQDDPILATWTYGLGRTAAITTDARNRWTGEWIGWRQAPRFWSQVVRWTMSRETGRLDVHASVEEDQVRVVLDARTADGSPIVSWTARATMAGGPGPASQVDLTQTRPGWYQATIRLPPTGAYLVTIVAREGDRLMGRASLPLAVPYSPELRQIGLNRPLISYLIEAADARVISTPAEALAPPVNPVRRAYPAWPLLSSLALVGFVAEVALRRIPAIEHQLSTLAAAVVAFIRRQPSPEAVAQDAEYAAADRWRIENPEEAAARAASMDAAARLYIARLRRQAESERGARDNERG